MPRAIKTIAVVVIEIISTANTFATLGWFGIVLPLKSAQSCHFVISCKMEPLKKPVDKHLKEARG